MALVATVGDADANSYVTQAEATLYFNDRAHASAWTSATNKDELLILSSQMLDWYMTWKGYRMTTTQGMQWPRTEVYRPSGSEVADDEIPKEVKIAVYELALSSIDGDRTEDSALAGISQVKVSTLMVKAGPGGSDSTDEKTIPRKIRMILKELILRGSMSVVRLVRA